MRSWLVSPFCVVAIAVLGCHRPPTVTLDAAPEGSMPPPANREGNLGALDGSLRSIGVPDLKLAGGGDPSSPPTDVLVELTIEGPTLPTEARVIDSMRGRFARCVSHAVKADASIAGSPKLVLAIAFNGDVTSATLSNPSDVSPVEAECLTRKAMAITFDAAPPHTLRITIRQSLAK